MEFGAGAALRVWTRIGLQSFGGGQAVQLLAYEELVERRRLLSGDEWAEALGICQMVPGINAIALAVLTGKRIGGWRGGLGAAAGLVVPSIAITIVLTAAFARARGSAWIHGAIHGLVLAAFAASLVSSGRLLVPALQAAAKQSRANVVAAVIVVLFAAALAASARLPIIAILLGSGVVLAVVGARSGASATPALRS